MIWRWLLAGWMAATCCAPAATAEQASAAPAGADVERCPYRFDSNMPEATFCVYVGAAFDGNGEACANDVLVIWSAGAQPVSVELVQSKARSAHEVYLAFVADPKLIVRAIVDVRQGDSAEMVEYSATGDEMWQPLAGQIKLRVMPPGSSETASLLSIKLQASTQLVAGSCKFASYLGVFLGVMQPPAEATISTETFIGAPL